MKKVFYYLCLICIILSICFSTVGCIPKEQDGTKTALSTNEKSTALSGNATEETSYYGVGRTINVITNDYITVDTRHSRIFDTGALVNLNWYRTRVGKMDAYAVSGTSMQQFYSALNIEYNKSMSAGAEIDIFSASAESKFGFSAGLDYENTANDIYYSASQYYAANLVEIDARANISQFYNMLAEEFIDDASAVEFGLMAPSEFIIKYGTHAVLAGYYGAKIEYNYYLRNTGTRWEQNMALQYASNIGASIGKLVNAKTSSDFSIREDIKVETKTTTDEFRAQAIGGKNFKALSIADFTEHYGEWIDSTNDVTAEHSVIIGLPQSSLVAVWDFLPANTFGTAKSLLQSYYEGIAMTKNSDFLSKFERHFIPSSVNEKSTVNIGKIELKSQQIYSDKTTPFYLEGLDIQALQNAGYRYLNISISGYCSGYDSKMNDYTRYFILSDATGGDIESWSFKVAGFNGVGGKNIPLERFNATSRYQLQLVSDKSNAYNEKLVVNNIKISIIALK